MYRKSYAFGKIEGGGEMSSLKQHLAVIKSNTFGGDSYSTLCGRESGKSHNRDELKNVTCKLCIKIINDPDHWEAQEMAIGSNVLIITGPTSKAVTSMAGRSQP